MLDEEYANKLTDYLIVTGHANVSYVTNIYEEGQYGFYEGTDIRIPTTTYIEYVDTDGNPVKNALDINIRELNKIIINMPTVELPPSEEEPVLD